MSKTGWKHTCLGISENRVENVPDFFGCKTISEKSVDVGRLLRSRPEWLAPVTGVKNDHGSSIHNFFGSIQRAADFGEIGRRRSTSPKSTEWLALPGGDKMNLWLFD